MSDILIRDANSGDFTRIVELNDAEASQTSAMDMDQLSELHRLSCYHRLLISNERVAAFLLVIRSGMPYENDNYGWFASRYQRFLYIDRIVVAKSHAGQHFGSRLYQDLFTYAREAGLAPICCEYNIEPSNHASGRFHARFGFSEVGQQYVANGKKLVSLQVVQP